MAEKRPPGFMTYLDKKEVILDLTDEEAGQLYKGLLEYSSGQEVKFSSRIVEIAFKAIKPQIDFDCKKYMETCERRAVNGRKGGQSKADSKKQDVAIAKFAKQIKLNINKDINKDINRNINKDININNINIDEGEDDDNIIPNYN